MKKVIEKLRQRSKHDRLMVAGGSAATVMSVLLFGWGIATLYSFDSRPAETQSATASLSHILTPVQEALRVNEQQNDTAPIAPSYTTEYATTTLPTAANTASSTGE